MIDKIKESGKHVLLWRKIYNNLCRSCKHKVFIAGTGIKDKGTEAITNRIDDVIKNRLCTVCRNRNERIIKNYTK